MNADTTPDSLGAPPVSSSRLARAAITVSIGSVVGRLLGLVREQAIAALFGRTAFTDAFSVASRVPTTAYDLLVGGMISAALVPVLSAEAERDDREFWRLVGLLFSVFSVILGFGVGAMFLAGPAIVTLIAPEFDGDKAALTLVMLQIMTPSLLFMGLSGVAVGVLQARRRFVAPAFGAAIFNLGFVLCVWALHVHGPEVMAFGIVTGAAAQLVLQALALRGAPIRLSLALTHPALRRVMVLYVPVALGLVVSAVGVMIDTNLASRLPNGDVSAMRYATTLTQFTLGVIATAIGAASLPELSRAAAVGTAALARALGEALRAVWTLIVPTALALAILREPVIRLLFERGAFGAADTAQTALAFVTYAPGIPAAAIDQILIFAFYARQDTIRPVLVGVGAVGVYVAVALALIGPLGMVGLTLANSAQWIGHALIMGILTLWLVQRVSVGAVAASVVRVTVAGAVAAALWWAASLPLSEIRHPIALFVGLALAGGVGGAAYFGVLWVAQAPEMAFVAAQVRRLRR